jgi:hypothetical protein
VTAIYLSLVRRQPAIPVLRQSFVKDGLSIFWVEVPWLRCNYRFSSCIALGLCCYFHCGDVHIFSGICGHHHTASNYSHVDLCGYLIHTNITSANVWQSLLSMIFLAFYNLTARRRILGFFDDEPISRTQRPTWIATRLLVGVCILWLITSGANLVVASRQPICFPVGYVLAYWQFGGICIAQRIGTAISILVL